MLGQLVGSKTEAATGLKHVTQNVDKDMLGIDLCIVCGKVGVGLAVGKKRAQDPALNTPS